MIIQNFVTETLNDFIKSNKSGSDYMMYCVKQLTHEDAELAKKFLKF